jgi:hypothetical protein
MLEVAGFRYYRDNLSSPPEIGQSVSISSEPDNPHDPGAVQVRYRNEKIGNVNRLQAPTFQKWLSERTVSATIERLNGKPDRPRVFLFVRVRAATQQAAA